MAPISKADLTAMKNEILGKISDLKADFDERLKKVEGAVGILEGQEDVADLITTVKDLSTTFENKAEELKQQAVSHMEQKLQEVTEDALGVWQRAMGMKVLANDLHNRKWCLILHGIPGEENERDYETVAKVVAFGNDKLGVPNTSIATAHRLNFHAPNSAIYLRFVKLHERNAWLRACSEKLTPADNKSLIPDIHPVLRDVRSNLLDMRKDLRRQQKKAHLKYIPEWPFMKLVVIDGDQREERLPEEDPDEILEIYFGLRERPERPELDPDNPAAAGRGNGRGRGRGHRGGANGYRGAPGGYGNRRSARNNAE